MSRTRSGVIVFSNGQLAVIDRHRPTVGRYLVLPGGGVEPGETLAEAAIREAREATGLRVTLLDAPGLCLRHRGNDQWFFRASVVRGNFGTGPLLSTGASSGTHRPSLLTRAEITRLPLVPLPVAEVLLRAWSTGDWWRDPLHLVDPEDVAPVRVRAGAVVLRGPDILLIARHQARDRWYEIPGGGVEAGEDPAGAVLRELREETGLVGRVERELAVVFKDGRREHYLLVTAEGSIVDRSTLDLEEDAEPVWCRLADLPTLPLWPKRLAWRVAEWAAHGWPAVPVRLTDTVDDLGAPCDW